MAQYDHNPLYYSDLCNLTMAGLGLLSSRYCGSHGRGPRFDPLCAHQISPCLLGFSEYPEKPNRQLETEQSANCATRPVENPWTLFAAVQRGQRAMTRLYILTAVGILGPLAFAALVAWLPRRHRLRERRGTLCLRIRRALALLALILDFPSAAWLNGFCNDWLLRGCKRTFSPFHHGVVTAYALEVGAAGQGDNRHPPLSAFGAVRYPIHEIPPDFFTHNSEL